MLGLKLPTDPRWVELVENNIDEILTDHAYCEQKAASNAISLIVRFPEYPDIVKMMTEIAQEEMQHFGQVHAHILKRGYKLGVERKDSYVNQLHQFCRRGMGKAIALMDNLLFAAMIEARSCERFKMLSERISDQELAAFYRELMVSEAQHYATFIQLAKTHCNPDAVHKRWEEFLAFEASIMKNYNKRETMHG